MAIWDFNDFINNSTVTEGQITNIDFSHEDCLDPPDSGTFQGPIPCLKFYIVKYEFSPLESQKHYGSSEMDESEIEKLPTKVLPFKAYVKYLPDNPKVNKLYGTKPKTIFQLVFLSNSRASVIDIAFCAIFLCSGSLRIRNVWKNRESLKYLANSKRG